MQTHPHPLDSIWNGNRIGWPVNCWGYDYYVKMMGDIENDRCPFCQISAPNRVALEGTYWTVIENAVYRANPAQDQPFVFVLKRHPEEHAGFRLDNMEGADLFYLFGEMVKRHNIVGGALVMRFGNDSKLCAATLKHPHAHLIRPTGNGSVTQVFAKSSKVFEAQYSRMIVYEKLRSGTLECHLTERERALVSAKDEAELVHARFM